MNFGNLVSFIVAPPKPLVAEQEPCVVSTGAGSEEQQRDSVSPQSADSPMSIPSPQQHSSSSSVSSLSGSDNVRANTHLLRAATSLNCIDPLITLEPFLIQLTLILAHYLQDSDSAPPRPVPPPAMHPYPTFPPLGLAIPPGLSMGTGKPSMAGHPLLMHPGSQVCVKPQTGVW